MRLHIFIAPAALSNEKKNCIALLVINPASKIYKVTDDMLYVDGKCTSPCAFIPPLKLQCQFLHYLCVWHPLVNSFGRWRDVGEADGPSR